MLQLVNDGAHLSEAARKHDYAEAIPFVARMFDWLCTMVSKVRVQGFTDLSQPVGLSDLVWNRYPGVCCLCGRRLCSCGSNVDYVPAIQRSQIEAGAQPIFDEARAKLRPGPLDDWIAMFDTIYETINRGKTLEDKVFHLLEEIGEVEVELRKADRVLSGAVPAGREAAHATIAWHKEIADVFSRMASIVTHISCSLEKRLDVVTRAEPWFSGLASLDREREAQVRPFSFWVWTAFSKDGVFWCHRCRQNPCVCVPASRR